MVSSLLFDVRSTDMLTLVGVAALVLVVVLLASVLPARSSIRIDPAIALRNEP